MTPVAIADSLKALRKNRGMTQKALAEASQTDVVQISRIERGDSNPSLETLKRLARALGCTTDALVFEADERAPSDDLQQLFELASDLPEAKRDMIKEFILTVVQRHQAQSLLKDE